MFSSVFKYVVADRIVAVTDFVIDGRVCAMVDAVVRCVVHVVVRCRCRCWCCNLMCVWWVVCVFFYVVADR
jgi:hypothetical protein